MDPNKLKSIADLGATGIILVILPLGLFASYKMMVKYLEDKREEDRIEREQKREEDKEERAYYRKKIDEKDEKLEENAKKTEKIVSKFTEILEKELNDVKYGVKSLAEKFIKHD